MSAQETTKAPPNGNWGWIIVVAFSINGITTISLMQGFVLIFKDIFPQFGFTATDGAIIINTNLAFGMILGLMNGPLIRTFGYRKMALMGSLLYTTGIIMTAFATTFPLIMISYGILTSLGMCTTMSGFSYALNSYFTTKRGRAMSLAVTIIAFGPIIMPHLTTFLTSMYGFQGTILLYGAISLHSFAASMLLQPLKWHTKKVIKSPNGETITITNENKSTDEKNTSFQSEGNSKGSLYDLSNTRSRKITISSIDHDAEIGSIYGFDVSFTRQISETLNVMYADMNCSQTDACKVESNRLLSTKSIHSINLGSSMAIFDEKPKSSLKYSNLNISKTSNYDLQSTMETDALMKKEDSKAQELSTNDDDKEGSQRKTAITQIIKKMAQMFDVDLLRDPIYINIMLGMSSAIFAEINFSQLTPFIFADMHLSNNQIATIMSIVAGVDLIFRSIAPFIGEWLRQPPRIMYTLSLCLLILSRSLLFFTSEFTSTILVAIGLGASKGLRSVYMPLVIPHHVPIDKLANASGFQMIANGIILLLAGPALGVIRDTFGSYTPCIIVMNSLTMLTVTMWTVEIYIVQRKKLQRKNEQQDKV